MQEAAEFPPRHLVTFKGLDQKFLSRFDAPTEGDLLPEQEMEGPYDRPLRSYLPFSARGYLRNRYQRPFLRRIIYLYAKFGFQLSDQQVADAIGCTVRTVRRWKGRAIRCVAISSPQEFHAVDGETSDNLRPAGNREPTCGAETTSNLEAARPAFFGSDFHPGQLSQQIEEIAGLLHIITRIGDGIGGDDGLAISSVTLNAKMAADRALRIIHILEAQS